MTPPVLSRDGAAVMMIAYSTTSQQDTATNDMVHPLRDTVLPQATTGTGIHGVHSRVGGVKGSGYAAAGVGSQGRPVRARVMASRTVRPWLRVVVR